MWDRHVYLGFACLDKHAYLGFAFLKCARSSRCSRRLCSLEQVAAAGLTRCVIPLHHCLLSMYNQSINNSASLRGVCCTYTTQLRFVVYVQIHHSATLQWGICCIYKTRIRLDCIYGHVQLTWYRRDKSLNCAPNLQMILFL